jgi:hypothetical protein
MRTGARVTLAVAWLFFVSCESSSEFEYAPPQGAELVEQLSAPAGSSGGGAAQIRVFAFEGPLSAVAAAYADQNPDANIVESSDGWQFEGDFCVVLEQWSTMTWRNLVAPELVEGETERLDRASGSFVEVTFEDCDAG